MYLVESEINVFTVLCVLVYEMIQNRFDLGLLGHLVPQQIPSLIFYAIQNPFAMYIPVHTVHDLV